MPRLLQIQAMAIRGNRMPASDEYLNKAIECARAVEDVRDPIERAALLKISRAFMNLARHAATRHGRGTASEHDPAEHLDDANVILLWPRRSRR